MRSPAVIAGTVGGPAYLSGNGAGDCAASAAGASAATMPMRHKRRTVSSSAMRSERTVQNTDRHGGPPAREEQLSLDQAATHLLEECRMVLPGIQALFGFQMIAVFNQRFATALSATEQRVHLAAILLVVSAVILV